MNNRNQNQAQNRLPVEPAAVAAPTYLNVFTVEEYESNGKTGKKWTKIGAAFPSPWPNATFGQAPRVSSAAGIV
jgi:hypothetical protein